MKNRLSISFIIPNWNNRSLLADCVASIMQSADPFDRDIVVVDNASADDSRAFVAEHYPGVRWIQNASNAGYARAVNQGAEASRGDLLFLLNNDVVLMEDTVAGLVGCLLKHPDAGAAAPVLVYPDGRLQISCRRFPTPAAILLEKLGIKKFGPFRKLKLTAEEHLKGGKVLQPMMSALMVRRESWEAVGPLDERFPIFFNDVDWCFRLFRHGGSIRLCPEIRTVHHEGASVNRLGFRKTVLLYQGLFRFYAKHMTLRMNA